MNSAPGGAARKPAAGFAQPAPARTTERGSVGVAAFSLDDFCERVRTCNPFLVNRVEHPGGDDIVDVFGINEPEFRRILGLARQAQSEQQGIGILLTGEAGAGKSHLLARLGQWARERQQAQFVYLKALSCRPERMPRALLQAILGGLTHGNLSASHQTPLFALMNATLREAAAQQGHSRGNWEQLRQAYDQLIGQTAWRSPMAGPLLNRPIYEMFFRYYQNAYPARHAGTNPIASLALRWLAGESLSSGEVEQLGIPALGAGLDNPVLSEHGHALQVFIALTELARHAGRLFLLCFDQADNLDDAQMQALARFQQDLLGSAGNLLVICAGARDAFERFVQQRAITPAAWDRLAQVEVNLGRISTARGRELLWARLQRFLAPARGEQHLEKFISRDALFPLGSPWLAARFSDMREARPRDLLVWAAQRWQQHQETLTTTPPNIWLNRMAEETAVVATLTDQKPTVVERKSDTQVDPPTDVHQAGETPRTRAAETARPGRS